MNFCYKITDSEFTIHLGSPRVCHPSPMLYPDVKDHREWNQTPHVPLHSAKNNMVALLLHAIQVQERLFFEYNCHTTDIPVRRVIPLALFRVKGYKRTFLRTWDCHRKAIRIFNIHQIAILPSSPWMLAYTEHPLPSDIPIPDSLTKPAISYEQVPGLRERDYRDRTLCLHQWVGLPNPLSTKKSPPFRWEKGMDYHSTVTITPVPELVMVWTKPSHHRMRTLQMAGMRDEKGFPTEKALQYERELDERFEKSDKTDHLDH